MEKNLRAYDHIDGVDAVLDPATGTLIIMECNGMRDYPSIYALAHATAWALKHGFCLDPKLVDWEIVDRIDGLGWYWYNTVKYDD